MRPTPPLSRGGFTFPEMLTVIALAALVLVALQQALIGQLRFHETQRAVSQRNESIRNAMAVLGTTLREASVTGGDVEILAPNRLRTRVPYGNAIVCGVDNNGGRVGIIDLRGRWVVGDSVIVRRGSGRYAGRVRRIDPAARRVPCTLEAPGSIVRLDENVPDVLIGSGIRTFRSLIFESMVQGGAQWQYRVEGVQSDLLLGPLDAVDGFTVWYEDATGAQVPDLTTADRVAVRVIARGPDVRGTPPLIRDTLLLRFGGRN